MPIPQINQSLLGDHTSVARKIKLNTILKSTFKTLITSKVQTVSKHVCNIILRAQSFVNYYVIAHADETVDKKVSTQNFWYCMTQLVLKKKLANTKVISEDYLTFWNSFSARYETTHEMTPAVNDYSQCVTSACIETATTYTNSIVECFESRNQHLLFIAS